MGGTEKREIKKKIDSFKEKQSKGKLDKVRELNKMDRENSRNEQKEKGKGHR
jgi:hypothetical protein